MYISGERWCKFVLNYCNLFNFFPALCSPYSDTNLNISHYNFGLFPDINDVPHSPAIYYDNFLSGRTPAIGDPPLTVHSGYEEGTTATYICPEGFISVGYITTTTCTGSRTWSRRLSLDPCYPGKGKICLCLMNPLLYLGFHSFPSTQVMGKPVYL